MKPGNILFTTEAEPKITDFGIAKAIGGSKNVTHTGAVIGTANYMSPEQAAGKNDEIGPVSDIYSLGAILYELLTGRPPFQASGFADACRQILNVEPEPPRRVSKAISRDIETICLKCLQKQPSSRYQSARALGEDIQRFLDDDPIKARRAGVFESALRLIRKRPRLVSLLVSMFVVAVALAATAVGTLQTTRALRTTREVNDGLFFQLKQDGEDLLFVASAGHSPSDELNYRRDRLATIQRNIGKWIEQERQDRKERREFAELLVLSGRIHEELGDSLDALELYEEAIAVGHDLVVSDVNNTELRLLVADTYRHLARVLSGIDKHSVAKTAARASLDVIEEGRAAFDDASLAKEVAASSFAMAEVLFEAREESALALAHYRRARDLLQEVCKKEPTPENYYYLADSWRSIGLHLHQRIDISTDREKQEQAEAAAYGEAIITIELALEIEPNALKYQRLHGRILSNLGLTQKGAENYHASIKTFEQSLAIRRQIAEDHPGVIRHHMELAAIEGNLADALFMVKEHDREILHRREAVRLCRWLAKEDPELIGYAERAATDMLRFFWTFHITGQKEEALLAIREAAAYRCPPEEGEPHDTVGRVHAAVGYALLCEASTDPVIQDRFAERSLTQLERAVELKLFDDPARRDEFDSEQAFEVLRGRNRFQQLLTRLGKTPLDD